MKDSWSHSQSWLWFGALFALIVHFFIQRVPVPQTGVPAGVTGNEPIELSQWEDLAKQKPVVKTSRADETDENDKSEADYAGEFKNRVKKQTQARNRGKFKEGGPVLPPGSPTPGTATEEGEGDSLGRLGMSDLMPFGSTPNALGDSVDPGNDTLLNTDPFLYASFINRIADQIYDAWDRFAREAVQSFEGRKELKPSTYVTRLGVVINAQGEVASVNVIQSCGFARLDDAPKKAFWHSGTFPNPPKQMLREDGLIRLVYEFHFELRSSSFSILPMNI